MSSQPCFSVASSSKCLLRCRGSNLLDALFYCYLDFFNHHYFQPRYQRSIEQQCSKITLSLPDLAWPSPLFSLCINSYILQINTNNGASGKYVIWLLSNISEIYLEEDTWSKYLVILGGKPCGRSHKDDPSHKAGFWPPGALCNVYCILQLLPAVPYLSPHTPIPEYSPSITLPRPKGFANPITQYGQKRGALIIDIMGVHIKFYE